ncbi:MAG: fused MFS/spermidine synthase [Pseudomonadota bacterium]
MSERPSLWLPVTLTLTSAASMALEIVAGRALAPYVGMSLYSWTMIIAVVLAGLSLGHWLGGWLADRSSAPRAWVAWGLAGAAIATALSLPALRWVEPFALGSGPVGHVGSLALAAFFLPSALAGLLSPLLTKMALDASPAGRHGRVVGRMFALGAFGAILGTLFAGLVLISWVGTAGSVMIITLCYAGLAIVFFSGAGRVTGVLLVGIFAMLGTFGPQSFLQAASCYRESAYFCIRIDHATFLGRDAGVMALDHLAHGVNDAADPKLLLTPYVHGVDEILRLRSGNVPPRAFFIGGGAYSLPRAWAARWPEAKLLVAEIDPLVTRTARNELWLPDASNLDIVHRDARTALHKLPPEVTFDVIFGDAFHDISVPQHLVTDEFHAHLAARLRPRGAYAMNVVDKQRSPRFVLSLAQTLRRQFAYVELWLDLEAIQPGEARTTWIVIASDRATPSGEVRSSYGFERRWVQVPLDAMIAEVGADQLVSLTDDYAPVDRLLGDLLLSNALTE